MTAGGCWVMGTLIEIVYGDEKYFFVLGFPEQPRQNKNRLYRQEEPNEPTKVGPHTLVRTPHVPICLGFNSQQGQPLSGISGSSA
jgi:hypothetical protein